MNAKERVRRTLRHEGTDRIPMGFSANPGIYRKLLEHFAIGDGASAHEALLTALNIDIRSVHVPYVGKRLHAENADKTISVSPDWGIRTRWVDHGNGGYQDFCEFPLSELTADIARTYPLPSPDDYDYSRVGEHCRKHAAFSVFAGGAGLVDILNGIGRLTGMEKVFLDMALGSDALRMLIERYVDVQFSRTERTLAASAGGIDILWIGEDLGTQQGPMISKDMYREWIRPHQKRFIDLAARYGIPVMVHTCGSSSWAYEDFIDMGVRAVDTLQPEAKQMAPAYLKRNFGGRLAFHGCISTAGPLSFGSVDACIEDCKNTIDIMKPGGGYCFAPTHMIQDNTPVANVLAMYETGLHYGR